MEPPGSACAYTVGWLTSSQVRATKDHRWLRKTPPKDSRLGRKKKRGLAGISTKQTNKQKPNTANVFR
jgi:hypothetical protein